MGESVHPIICRDAHTKAGATAACFSVWPCAGEKCILFVCAKTERFQRGTPSKPIS